MKISILKNQKLRNKFCIRMNKTFGCRDAYMCNIACPFHLAIWVEELMNEKNYTLGEAFRETIRMGIDHKTGRAIIRNAIHNKDRPYPKKPFKEIRDDFDRD